MNHQLVKDTIHTILQDHQEGDILDEVDEIIPEYINDDWEDEYDSMYECYEETGRGEAESQVLEDVILSTGINFNIDEYCEIFNVLAERWCLSTN